LLVWVSAKTSVEKTLLPSSRAVVSSLPTSNLVNFSPKIKNPLRPTSSPTRRFPANQIPTLRFHALLNEKAPEVELALV
jgi:hypothetical protein